ncbi:hypothetical protein EAS64_15990 [Trebonia kvetii]|uniref:Uncharacterized protein n=1 Tax=Trebonia kvetii TaxID=2480626 RepID=A0A6P2BXY9_9ACTN|nr:hypothetical protein [Trebonia kvetii]TVZ03934.1 hypothetical protein EAS64_15990 [Trebonia kvetii]
MSFSVSRPNAGHARRTRRSARLTGAALAAAVAVLPGVMSLSVAQAAVRAPASAPSVKAGLTGPAITLANNTQFSGYDLATGPNGTAYIGWIGDNGSGRKVSLCTLPHGAKACAGGIRTVVSAPDGIGTSTATGLWVLVSKSNLVTLVWMYSTVASENGPEGDVIATATSQGGGPLSAAKVSSAGPSFGTLLDAVLAPGGKIWTVAHAGGGVSSLQVTRGLGSAPQTVKTPFQPGHSLLAFSGSSAVLAIDKAGAISQPVSYARQSGGGWTGFKAIAKTWNLAGFGMAGTTSGVRVIASENNAGYHPVVSALTSSGFSAPVLTGDTNNCPQSNHDTVADASGRLADVTHECQAVTVANLANTRHAAIFRFSIPASQTFAGGDPQLTTAPSGRGWVAWSVESKVNDRLVVAPLLLAGLSVTVKSSGKGGKVAVTGPSSCLPPVNIAVGVSAKAAAGWTVIGKSLKLGGGTVGSVLKGAGLTSGKSYTLTGTVTFGRGGSRATEHAALTFRTCQKP